MVKLTSSAATRLKQLMREHPDDPIVRVTLTDLDETRLACNITLDDHAHEGDQVQTVDGLTVAVEGRSAARMEGVTVDFQPTRGFTIVHPPAHDDGELKLIHLN